MHETRIRSFSLNRYQKRPLSHAHRRTPVSRSSWRRAEPCRHRTGRRGQRVLPSDTETPSRDRRRPVTPRPSPPGPALRLVCHRLPQRAGAGARQERAPLPLTSGGRLTDRAQGDAGSPPSLTRQHREFCAPRETIHRYMSTSEHGRPGILRWPGDEACRAGGHRRADQTEVGTGGAGAKRETGWLDSSRHTCQLQLLDLTGHGPNRAPVEQKAQLW